MRTERYWEKRPWSDAISTAPEYENSIYFHGKRPWPGRPANPDHENHIGYFHGKRNLTLMVTVVLCLVFFCFTPSMAESLENDKKGGVSEDALDGLFFEDESMTENEAVRVLDPISGVNRVMFAFNDKLYFYLLKPVAKGYQAVTPEFLRVGIRNMFQNALFPLRFVNNALQGKFRRSIEESRLFLINTVAGGLGFATPGQDYFGLEIHDEDLGQTLGYYGIGHGLYLVLPILGASSLRDGIGSAGDTFLKPLTYVESSELSAGLGILETVNGVSFRIGEYEALKAAALDPYVALKDAYLQMRKKRVEE